MLARRPASRRSLVLVAALLAATGSVVVPSHGAAAQEQTPARADDDRRIEELVRSLTNNRVVARNDDEVRTRIAVLLDSGNPYARRKLREVLANTSAPPKVIEHLGKTILFDSSASDLVPDVIERLRVERESALGRAFDGALLRYAGAQLVRELAALARDTSRSPGFRLTSIRALGTTAHTQALPVLAELWGDPAPEIRLAASRAFVHIVPFVRDRDGAERLLAEMSDEGVPLIEVLRRRLREIEAAPVVRDDADYQHEYVALATAALPHMPLGEVVDRYLTSPVAAVRGSAAERLSAFEWDAKPDPAMARISAGMAMLATLGHEEDAAVERALLAALFPLARDLRDHVGNEALDTLIRRTRESGGATRDVRVASIQLLGALRPRDPRAVDVLQDEFDALGDTDPDLRIAILKSLSSIAVDLTGWLRERVVDEEYDRVAEAMAVELAKATDPGAVPVFEQLLSRPHPSEIVRHTASTGLVNLWSTRGVVAARAALIRLGLNDQSVTVRENSALGLGTRASDDPVLLDALQGVALRPEEDARVRKAAAGSILALEPDGAVERLQSAFASGPIWEVYRERRVDDLLAGGIDVTDVLRDADALWATNEMALRDRAVQLLQAVVDAGNGLWNGPEGRGLVHERLAGRLLESGRPEDACEVAEALLSEDLRADDPQFRWRFLLARSLRACGASEPLHRAARQLESLRTAADLPPAMRTDVLLELGDALLQVDDPTGAKEAIAMIGDAVDLTLAQKNRRDELRELADERSTAEHKLVMELIVRGTESDARAELQALGFRAARHVHAELVTGVEPTRLRQLMTVVEILTGKTYGVPDGITGEELDTLLRRARDDLAAEIEKGFGPDGR